MAVTDRNAKPTFSPSPFVPRRFMRSADGQTIFGWLLSRPNLLPPSQDRLFSVEPEVQVLCRCNWQPERAQSLTVVLVHGLEGSSESQYILGTANKAWRAGMNVVRMNMRNCGGTERLGPTLYHSGMSADVGAVLRTLIEQDGLRRVALAGFSMGGNLVLKLAGEFGRDGTTPPQLVAVAGVSPAVDLGPSADALNERRNRLYEWNFVWHLRRSVERKAALFPELYDVARLSGIRSVRGFDDKVTAPYSGFRDADDYYTRSSASQFLQHVALPALIVYAADDPFIRILPETRAKIAANRSIVFVETAHGGHCGFLATPSQAYSQRRHGDTEKANEPPRLRASVASSGDDGRWAEQQVVEFFRHAAHGSP